MISEQLKQEVQDWIKNDPDKKTAGQLTKWLSEENEEELNRCFSGFLQFGTAGLRGALGPGPSNMNRAVVSRLDVNCVREKKLTNMRASGTDETERLIPAKKLNMEGALEFCREDECVEVTPAVVRIRKVILDGSTRARNTSKAKRANENS